MAKIVELKTEATQALDLLKEMYDEFEKKKINNLMCIWKTPDGEVMVGWTETLAKDLGQTQELISNAQLYLTRKAIRQELEE